MCGIRVKLEEDKENGVGVDNCQKWVQRLTSLCCALQLLLYTVHCTVKHRYAWCRKDPLGQSYLNTLRTVGLVAIGSQLNRKLLSCRIIQEKIESSYIQTVVIQHPPHYFKFFLRFCETTVQDVDVVDPRIIFSLSLCWFGPIPVLFHVQISFLSLMQM